MSEALRLDGTMIPRRVKRLFDQRTEARVTTPTSAQFDWRGASYDVQLANISASGAMIGFDKIPNIGEAATLTLPGEAPSQAVVRWVRDGRIGLHFNGLVG